MIGVTSDVGVLLICLVQEPFHMCASSVLRGGMAPIMGIFFIFIPGLSFLDMLCIFEKQATFLWDYF